MFTLVVDDNIQLKLLEKRDAGALIQLVNDNREYLREWLPWVDDMQTAEDYYPIIDMWLEQFAKNDGFQAGILYEEKLVGMIGFHGIDWNKKKTSIGYKVRSS
jgi:ribosomal-protein-serine acetyltransferase